MPQIQMKAERKISTNDRSFSFIPGTFRFIVENLYYHNDNMMNLKVLSSVVLKN